MRGLFSFIGWLAVCFAAAAAGAIASVQAAEFYAGLTRPDWAPPASVFGPVWSVLYFLMAVAAWRVWRLGGWRHQGLALTFFLVQLGLNALWSWLFFHWHLGAFAFVDVIALWVLLLITVLSFWRVDRLSAVLLVPYLAWVSFASALNFSVWQLNPAALG